MFNYFSQLTWQFWDIHANVVKKMKLITCHLFHHQLHMRKVTYTMRATKRGRNMREKKNISTSWGQNTNMGEWEKKKFPRTSSNSLKWEEDSSQTQSIEPTHKIRRHDTLDLIVHENLHYFEQCKQREITKDPIVNMNVEKGQHVLHLLSHGLKSLTKSIISTIQTQWNIGSSSIKSTMASKGQIDSESTRQILMIWTNTHTSSPPSHPHYPWKLLNNVHVPSINHYVLLKKKEKKT